MLFRAFARTWTMFIWRLHLECDFTKAAVFAKIFLLPLDVGTDIMWCMKVSVCLREEGNITCKYAHNSRIMRESALFSHSVLCVQRGRDALTHWKSSLIQTNTGFAPSPSIIYQSVHFWRGGSEKEKWKNWLLWENLIPPPASRLPVWNNYHEILIRV